MYAYPRIPLNEWDSQWIFNMVDWIFVFRSTSLTHREREPAFRHYERDEGHAERNAHERDATPLRRENTSESRHVRSHFAGVVWQCVCVCVRHTWFVQWRLEKFWLWQRRFEFDSCSCLWRFECGIPENWKLPQKNTQNWWHIFENLENDCLFILFFFFHFRNMVNFYLSFWYVISCFVGFSFLNLFQHLFVLIVNLAN